MAEGTEVHALAARRVTWLELFFDLVFAAAIASLATLLDDHRHLPGFFGFLAVLHGVFWVWGAHTVYTSRFGHDDALDRGFTFALMVVAAAMAVHLPHAFDAGAPGFVLALAGARLLLMGLHARPHRHLGGIGGTHAVYLAASALVVACWLGSLALPAPGRYVLWGAAVAVDLVFPVFDRTGLRRFPVDVHHLPERLGLFVLLVLGETFLELVASLSAVPWDLPAIAAAALAIGLAAGIWWAYYSFVELADHECTLGTGIPYIYGHFPLVAALVVIAVGVHHAVLEAGGRELPTGTACLLALGTAGWVLAFLGLQVLAERDRVSGRFMALYAGVAAAIALAGLPLGVPPLVAMAVVAGLLAGLVAFEVRFCAAEIDLILGRDPGRGARPVARIFVDEVRERLARGEAPVFLDVRRHPDDHEIPGSVRYAPDDLLGTAGVTLPYDRDRLIITYCT
jgi:low temperature requirement protein LtrA